MKLYLIDFISADIGVLGESEGVPIRAGTPSPGGAGARLVRRAQPYVRGVGGWLKE